MKKSILVCMLAASFSFMSVDSFAKSFNNTLGESISSCSNYFATPPKKTTQTTQTTQTLIRGLGSNGTKLS